MRDRLPSGAAMSSAAPAPVVSPLAAPSGEEKLSAALQLTLKKYRAHEDKLKTQHLRGGPKVAKADAVANAQLKGKLRPPVLHGHIAGMPPGTVLQNRGEVAILGGHTQIFCGIDSNAKKYPAGALAIVLSGGYRDDKDEGTTFWYTGSGGRGKEVGLREKQVTDQKFTGSNRAMQRNKETGKPVRVWRGKVHEVTKKAFYVYQGLYNVTAFKLEASSDGPLVCKFLMVGIPGESVATVQVAFQAMKFRAGGGSAARMQSGLLVEALAKRGRAVPMETPELIAARRQEIVDSIALRPTHLLLADLSDGLEDVPIPVFNEVNTRGLDFKLDYLRDYSFAASVEEQVAPILAAEAAKLATFCDVRRHQCGSQFSKGMRQKDLDAGVSAKAATPIGAYVQDGRLRFNEPFGVHECGAACFGASGNGCQACLTNRVVTNGVRLPLEVMMTVDKGWGVRCAQDIATGTFVVCYTGELITNDMGNKLRGPEADYVLGLTHLSHNARLLCEEGLAAYPDVPTHKWPPPPHFASLDELRPVLAAEAAQKAAEELAEQRADDEAAAAAAAPGAPGSLLGGSPVPPAAANGRLDCPASSDADAMEPGTSRGGEDSGVGAAAAGAVADAAAPSRLLLSVDALKRGNIARFINHCCGSSQDCDKQGAGICSNLVAQPVYARNARSGLLYYLAFFAARNIAAGEELLWSYNYEHNDGAVKVDGRRVMDCHCGALSCPKSLILGD